MEEAPRPDPVQEAETEARLIDASVRGGVQAFSALYDRHLERVYRYIFYRVGNRPDAEDLTQQVFLKAWKAINRYRRTGASFIAWLLSIAHNEVVSFYRRSKNECCLDGELESQERWADPENEIMNDYDALAVRRAILHLKPEQQQVIIMRFIEDLDYADIAASLGKSQGNVRVIQHRALAELHRLLVEEARQ